MTDRILSDEQTQAFLEHGHVTVPGCFTRAQAQPWLDAAWVRLGYHPHDPRTWTEKRIHMPSTEHARPQDAVPLETPRTTQPRASAGCTAIPIRASAAGSPP